MKNILILFLFFLNYQSFASVSDIFNDQEKALFDQHIRNASQESKFSDLVKSGWQAAGKTEALSKVYKAILQKYAEDDLLAEEEQADGGSTGLENTLNATHIGTFPPAPQTITTTLEPGFFYRMDPTVQKARGVYAKSVKYYKDDLFIDYTNPSIETHTFAQDTAVENWFGVTFFGIWSYDNNERYKRITIPVRSLGTDKKMAANTACPRCIWKTGHGEEETITVQKDKKFRHIPCNGAHTETGFITYIKKTETQIALWDYFLEESLEKLKDITHADRKLSCIGFNCFSTNDACDECLEKLFNLKEKRLTNLPPVKSSGLEYTVDTLNFPIPFLITYKSKQFYHPECCSFSNLAYNARYSASLLFMPRLFLRLGKKTGQKHESNFVENEEEEIQHHKKIEIKDSEEIDFLVLMVAKGAATKVTTQPAIKKEYSNNKRNSV